MLSACCFQPGLLNQPLPSQPRQLKLLLQASRVRRRRGQHRLGKALNDKKAEPELLDAQAGVKLVVPQMEKVGKLRQSSTPKAGMTYWMAFSNPTLAVKRGHRVDVVIGSFRATNLVVE